MVNIMVKKHKVIRAGIIICLLLCSTFVILKVMSMKKSIYYSESDKVIENPYIGYVASADYHEEAEKTSMVYVDVTWREWEPEEGQYNYDSVAKDNYLKDWKAAGKKIVLRFLCDMPSKEDHLDIPDWLYEATGEDGTHYVSSIGMGYSPDYTNPILIEKHRAAIKALGEYFAKDDMVAYVEMGSIGHWGEWHVYGAKKTTSMPDDEVCLKYVEPYIDAFPDASLIMRRPYSIAANLGLGVYNDMTGMVEDTEEWLSWIEAGSSDAVPSVVAIPEIWNSQPVGGEFTSSLPMETMLGSNLEETLNLIQKSHMSFIGPMCPVIGYDNYKGAVDEVEKNLGYRFYVSESMVYGFKWNKEYNFKVTLNNSGNAPFYKHWPVKLYSLDDKDKVLDSQLILEDVSTIGYKSSEILTGKIPKGWIQKDKTLVMGIENPKTGEPEITFAQEGAESKLVEVYKEK